MEEPLSVIVTIDKPFYYGLSMGIGLGVGLIVGISSFIGLPFYSYRKVKYN